MGLAEQRNKSAAYAQYMKEKGVRRVSAKCPWGCGATYSIVDGTGQSLLNHLTRCLGGGARRLSAQRRRARQ